MIVFHKYFKHFQSFIQLCTLTFFTIWFTQFLTISFDLSLLISYFDKVIKHDAVPKSLKHNLKSKR